MEIMAEKLNDGISFAKQLKELITVCPELFPGSPEEAFTFGMLYKLNNGYVELEQGIEFSERI